MPELNGQCKLQKTEFKSDQHKARLLHAVTSVWHSAHYVYLIQVLGTTALNTCNDIVNQSVKATISGNIFV